MIPDRAPPYEFDSSGALRDRFRRMLDRAGAIGRRPEIERSIAFIVDRLVHDPRGWGDPVRNLRHAKLTEYHGRHNNFLAVYAVHDRVPMVFLSQLNPLEGNPLFGESFGG